MISWQTCSQVALFCLVGGMNTFIDFSIYNMLTRSQVGCARIPANIVATSIAMLFSFSMNWFLVFHPDGGSMLSRAARFLLTTLFSTYVLQNVVIYTTSEAWRTPTKAAQRLVKSAGLSDRLSPDFVERNAVKAMAVGAGLFWNFAWYKCYVFSR